jgi:uncharacterized RDD family membrane protein YckC
MASMFRRVMAWLIDYTIVLIPSVVVVGLAISSVVHGLPAYVGGVAGEFGWSRLMRLVTHAGAEPGALRAAVSSEWIPLVLPLIGALLLVPVIQFAYQAAMLSWRGRTVGKMLADTRVGMTGDEAPRVRKGAALRRAFSTTLLETGVVSLAFAIVVFGELTIGLFIWGIAVLAFWLNAFAALGPRRRTIVDRLSGTVVVRRALSTEVAQVAIEATRTTSDAAVAATRRGSELAVTAGRTTSQAAVTAGRSTSQAAVTAGRATADAAAVAGQLAREGAEAAVRSAPVQQVLNSRAAQQAQSLGTAGADKARQLGEQAAGGARRFGLRAKQKWQERQARREGEELPQLTAEPEAPATE